MARGDDNLSHINAVAVIDLLMEFADGRLDFSANMNI